MADPATHARPPRPLPRIHHDGFVTYQLERAHGLGALSADLTERGAQGARRASDVPAVFGALAAEAEREGRLRDAVGCARLAEFFTVRPSAAQVAAYERYVELWDRSFGREGVTRHDVPYEAGILPALRYPAQGPRLGTVVGFGGFDSLIEEFDAIWRGLAAAGYEVVAFDGPGQGGARTRHGLAHTHDWERPVAAVLDHFELDGVTLVGMSMGGYWAIRAAAHEPRVARVVAWPPVFDWLAALPRPVAGFVRRMSTWRRFMNAAVALRMRLIPVLRHVVSQANWISRTSEPVDAVTWLLGMNAAHVGSERVRVPVLLFVGERDRFQSPALAERQARALTRAPSVTTRTFTVAEGAAGHCQLGNLPLATDELLGWLDRHGSGRPAIEGVRRDPTAAA